ncbi:hypothetical protein D9611_015077 [Ephemerocybe angulata]|uniref:Uncharacterized protein n=1 Tax=Ephemerocybe angulata TaxID=980116 RepID=A0A8H5F8V6_9AGAR|nr:hypothetical protein D9611_015077 [Tulosesus angulatus]
MAPSKRRQPTKEPKPAKKLHCRRCDGSPLLTECAHSRKAQAGPPPAGQNPVIDPTLAVQQGPALAAQQVPMYPQFQFGQMNPYAFNFNPPSATPAGVQSYPLELQVLRCISSLPGIPQCRTPGSSTPPPMGLRDPRLRLLLHRLPELTSLLQPSVAGLMPSACAVPEPAGAVPLPDGELETSDVTSQPAPSVTTSPTPLVDDHVDSVSQHGQKRPREDSMNSSPAPASKKRAYASGAKPIFDWIEGVGRGARNWRLARKRPLLPEIVDNARATKCYSGWVHDLMSRCESISIRSGCWMYVAVQHPSARTPFTHYSSPKLRAEAPAALASFHKDVSMTMTSLVRADRKAKVESIVEALRNKARAEAAEAKTAATEQKLALANERLEELERRLESLTVITEENELYPPEDEPEEDDEEEFSETEEPL